MGTTGRQCNSQDTAVWGLHPVFDELRVELVEGSARAYLADRAARGKRVSGGMVWVLRAVIVLAGVASLFLGPMAALRFLDGWLSSVGVAASIVVLGVLIAVGIHLFEGRVASNWARIREELEGRHGVSSVRVKVSVHTRPEVVAEALEGISPEVRDRFLELVADGQVDAVEEAVRILLADQAEAAERRGAAREKERQRLQRETEAQARRALSGSRISQ